MLQGQGCFFAALQASLQSRGLTLLQAYCRQQEAQLCQLVSCASLRSRPLTAVEGRAFLCAGLFFREALLAESCLWCRILLITPPCCYAELCFKSSTRMKPNWLVFMLRLSTGDTIYVQYLVPTLIMSRQSDQLPKVMSSHVAVPHYTHRVVPTPTASRQNDQQPRVHAGLHGDYPCPACGQAEAGPGCAISCPQSVLRCTVLT